MNRVLTGLFAVAWLAAIWSTARVSARAAEAAAERNGEVIVTLHAMGSQIYECKPDPGKPASEGHALTWQFREPVAALLLDGKSVGRHYAGPSWDHIDGSGVKAKVIASTAGATADDIAWLDLDVIERHGSGTLSDAATVQRVNTKGGVTHGSCESAGGYLSVPYSADYVFRRKS
jgi:Protein of unknown function (DUF3455)